MRRVFFLHRRVLGAEMSGKSWTWQERWMPSSRALDHKMITRAESTGEAHPPGFGWCSWNSKALSNVPVIITRKQLATTSWKNSQSETHSLNVPEYFIECSWNFLWQSTGVTGIPLGMYFDVPALSATHRLCKSCRRLRPGRWCRWKPEVIDLGFADLPYSALWSSNIVLKNGPFLVHRWFSW